ncbi:hypothetical protein ACFL2C_03325 [Patescibacteria group bacterium]
MATKSRSKKPATKIKTENTHDHEKANRFLRYLSIVLVIVFTSFSLITLTARSRLLSPNVYKTAVNQSGIYELTSDVIQEKTTEALLALQQEVVTNLGLVQDPKERTLFENVIIFVLGSALDEATKNLVANVAQRIDLTTVIRSTTEGWIENDIAWLRGERSDPEIFEIIPAPEEIERVRNAKLSDVAMGVTAELFDLSNLPACTNAEDVELNVARVKDGSLTKVTCTNSEITILLNSTVSDLVPQDVLEEAEVGIQSELDRLGLTPVIDALFDISLLMANLKQFSLELRDLAARTYETSIFFLAVSIPLLIYSLIVTKKDRFRTLLRTYLATGLVVTAFGVIIYIVLSNTIANFIGDITITTDGFLSGTQQVKLAQSIRSIELYIVRDVSYFLLLVGVVITVVFATPLVILKALGRSKYSPRPETS